MLMKRHVGLALLAAIVLIRPAQAQRPAPPVESIRVHGFAAPIPGRWLSPQDNASGLPLGGIGAGWLALSADGLVHEAVIRNDWLKPASPPAFALVATC